MPVHERRQHFRIEDHIYFDYRVLKPEIFSSDKCITDDDMLGESEQHFLETSQYFQSLNKELLEVTQSLAFKEPAVAHYLNLLNAKIDYLGRRLLVGEKINIRKVNLSLGGMSFKSKDRIPKKTALKMIIYTRPQMIPIIVDAITVHSEFLDKVLYRTAVKFEKLTGEQEQLLSQHIIHAQVKCREV